MAGKAAAIVFFVDVRKKPTPILGINFTVSLALLVLAMRSGAGFSMLLDFPGHFATAGNGMNQPVSCHVLHVIEL
jgi:hypothetical protein